VTDYVRATAGIILTFLPISSYSCLMSAARSVGGRRKTLRSGVITSESRPGGLAGQLAGAMPTSSLSPVAMPPVAMPPAGIPSAGMPPAARPARPVSALGRSAATGESDADRAVTAIYGSQYRTLVRLAVLLVGDLRMAEELVQDSFAAMHHAWRRLRNQDAAVSFLHRSVVTRSRLVGPGLAVAPRYETLSDEAGRRALRAVPLRAAPPAGTAEATSAQEPARTEEPAETVGQAGAADRAGAGKPPGTGEPTDAGAQAGAGMQARGGAAGRPGAADPAGVVAALQQLPVMQREALALRLYLDLPDDQIAAAMRVTHARARDHVAGGLAALHGMA
jgi:DNA-directed RNA polymerase specialized sigma24 family protein